MAGSQLARVAVLVEVLPGVLGGADGGNRTRLASLATTHQTFWHLHGADEGNRTPKTCLEGRRPTFRQSSASCSTRAEVFRVRGALLALVCRPHYATRVEQSCTPESNWSHSFIPKRRLPTRTSAAWWSLLELNQHLPGANRVLSLRAKTPWHGPSESNRLARVLESLPSP